MASALVSQPDSSAIEKALISGDLSKLDINQRLSYYKQVCESLGLNPLTRPFDYLNLNGKLILYATRACTEQLRLINGVSIHKMEKQKMDDLYVVTAYARDKHGREDSSTGAVSLGALKGEAAANAMMKAETKAKRRVTLSICGLGLLDEMEVSTIPTAKTLQLAAADYEKTSPYAANIERAEAQGQEQDIEAHGASTQAGMESDAGSSSAPEVIESNEEFEISAKLISAKPANNGVWLEFPKFRAAVTSEKWVKFLHDKGVEAGWTLDMVCTSIMVEGVEHWKVVVIKHAEPRQTYLEKQLAASVELLKGKKKAYIPGSFPPLGAGAEGRFPDRPSLKDEENNITQKVTASANQ